MTDNSHPITPPSEDLVNQWDFECESEVDAAMHIATQAARWGADMELDACCELLDINGCPGKWIDMLRAARRPKPPSLKEQAQRIFVENGTTLDGRMKLDPDDIAIIRRALEALPD